MKIYNKKIQLYFVKFSVFTFISLSLSQKNYRDRSRIHIEGHSGFLFGVSFVRAVNARVKHILKNLEEVQNLYL